jgi:hypothetical protein
MRIERHSGHALCYPLLRHPAGVEAVRAHHASNQPTILRILVELSIASLALGLIVAVLLIREARQPLDAKDLKIAASDLNSLAAAGVLLASQSPGASVTENYFKVQSRSWHEKVEQTNKDLRASPPAKDQQHAHQENLSVAKDLASVAGQLAGSTPTEGERAAALGNLQTLEARASALRSKLTDEPAAQ